MEICGDDGVDAGGLAHHARRHRIHQLLLDRDMRKILGDMGSHLIPEDHAMALRVGLGDHGQQLAWARFGNLEGRAHDPLDADAGEDGGLGGDLDGVAAMRAATMAGIFALAVLTHDHPVDGAGSEAAQG